MKIRKVTLDHVIDFAAEELKKYLMMMMPESNGIKIEYGDGEGLRLGLMSDLGIEITETDTPLLDDVVYIDTDKCGGIIAGSNVRSVLLAVYEYLKQNGCRWLFPGIDGEYIPHRQVEKTTYRKMADRRFRGQCIEGGEAQKNVLDAIDFIPKAGLNSFMMEFEVPILYYRLWYDHECNRFKEKESVTVENVWQWKRQSEAEIAKRGILFHDIGHGWAASSLGIDTSRGESDKNLGKIELPEEVRQYIAQINGKRELFENVAINTNFCMSNKKAREIVANYIADYAERNIDVDFLHVWLADGHGNHCECAECKKMDTADHYITFLNDIDAEFLRRGITTKLVFIAYTDLFWAPQQTKLNHPDRFAMLFAPISRSYTQSYDEPVKMSAVTPYDRNKNKMPVGMGENLAYLCKWKESYSGDCIGYEYHFHWVHFCDPGHISISKRVFEDVRTSKSCGLCGIIEDQTQRCSYPTGLPVYTYAASLRDGDITFDKICEDYFKNAFDVHWKKASDFLNQMSNLFDFNYMTELSQRRAKPSHAIAENMEQVTKIANDFKSVCKELIIQPRRCSSVSWQRLYIHCDYCAMLAKAVYHVACGDAKNAQAQCNKLLDFMAQKEDYLQDCFDLGLFNALIAPAFNSVK